MPEKVAVLSKIRLLLFISPKFTTSRHPRAICRKDTAVRIEADGYFLWLEKWIMQCYFVMSSEKKIPHKIPTMWSMFFICKLFNNCKMQKIRRLSKCVQWVHLPPPFQKQCTSNGVLFFAIEGGDHGASRVRHLCRGVETSGSTARSDVREDFAPLRRFVTKTLIFFDLENSGSLTDF